ncbi:8150_t:CDS:2 [Racocetra persica]|uniref:8150_t:CDS:1 n=1 Tax=Racocetra persica TaxID=160502 RepID=A0ACA9NE79_9GLOM|nr:8150_t:CDS:2 [Racocetra persica]
MALKNKNVIFQVKASLKDLMKIITNDNSNDNVMAGQLKSKKTKKWFTDNISSAIEELLEVNKNAND